jgi:hypothetical protein
MWTALEKLQIMQDGHGYVDDVRITICPNGGNVKQALDEIENKLAGLGLKVHPRKTTIHTNGPREAVERQLRHTKWQHIKTQHRVCKYVGSLTGLPTASDHVGHIEQEILSKLPVKLERTLSHPELSKHNAFLMLQLIPSVFYFLASTTPPTQETRVALKKIDTVIYRILRTRFGIKTDERARRIIHLPTRMGGLGIPSRATLHPIDYIATIASTIQATANHVRRSEMWNNQITIRRVQGALDELAQMFPNRTHRNKLQLGTEEQNALVLPLRAHRFISMYLNRPVQIGPPPPIPVTLLPRRLGQTLAGIFQRQCHQEHLAIMANEAKAAVDHQRQDADSLTARLTHSIALLGSDSRFLFQRSYVQFNLPALHLPDPQIQHALTTRLAQPIFGNDLIERCPMDHRSRTTAARLPQDHLLTCKACRIHGADLAYIHHRVVDELARLVQVYAQGYHIHVEPTGYLTGPRHPDLLATRVTDACQVERLYVDVSLKHTSAASYLRATKRALQPPPEMQRTQTPQETKLLNVVDHLLHERAVQKINKYSYIRTDPTAPGRFFPFVIDTTGKLHADAILFLRTVFGPTGNTAIARIALATFLNKMLQIVTHRRILAIAARSRRGH